MLELVTPNDPLPEGEVTPVGLRVISAMELGEDALKRCGIQPGMHVYDLECGTGDASLAIAGLVGPTGLVVGIDKSAETIDVAANQTTRAGLCHWTRFIIADLNIFVPCERFDAVVVRLTGLHPRLASFSRLCSYVRPYGLIVIAFDTPPNPLS
jgi:SAM-dependent methyltransferase